MDENLLYPELRTYVASRVQEFAQISSERKAELGKLGRYIQEQSKSGKPVRLIFICTHNSRRSHLAQVWGTIAAAHYQVEGVETYSGGTETTAFNPRAVAALERAGLVVERGDEPVNPHYSLRFSPKRVPLNCFSKTYDAAPNPATEFCAIMTCSNADEGCPVVPGANARIVISYADPKIADDTPQESSVYDERCRQIAREVFYAFRVASKKR